jgi:hypothetical protein
VQDLPAAQMAVQAIHAAIEAARQFLAPDQPHPHLVLCRVSSERDLLAAADRLERLGAISSPPPTGSNVSGFDFRSFANPTAQMKQPRWPPSRSARIVVRRWLDIPV